MLHSCEVLLSFSEGFEVFRGSFEGISGQRPFLDRMGLLLWRPIQGGSPVLRPEQTTSTCSRPVGLELLIELDISSPVGYVSMLKVAAPHEGGRSGHL